MTTESGLPTAALPSLLSTALPARYAAAIARRADEVGGLGANRGDAERRQLRAETDLDAIVLWLENYADRPTTHANYRKEAERLLLWALAETLQRPGAIAPDDVSQPESVDAVTTRT